MHNILLYELLIMITAVLAIIGYFRALHLNKVERTANEEQEYHLL